MARFEPFYVFCHCEEAFIAKAMKPTKQSIDEFHALP
jgi:hypothetical protein